ncbi:bifunctional diaminohydroxyphosphoribosylaminopyrimidine deaminase/5-amino-6-(5-phosphoribosylamino)uracil reductase RibD [Nannocystis bainbridge]|uniref:Riboflavin biosynthesis protein RibD n=1 Tax=Nannocystis bainbridge TaxID=2995303 RepID=A0ABT5DQA6_9BACT|nr:bifunctional diaminohydroxyphosphoribosylaminopyrimidine deaminase/5-amino-6-(5-phosphoribosylamino)uracil reductase RibD [Nannocystis bainbridge]MDC0715325.1 bifunctional diaminohydroxyphosphoribosylaminopyrimidine deaminase/5-amino-6-(5-phosphoribosylamino)uracil reductase RibD [Nannocystis bainbridge]
MISPEPADLLGGADGVADAGPAAIAAALTSTPVAGESAEARDVRWMGVAVALARSGTGATYPNPCVGAIVVQGDRVVGAGRSAPTGGPHAEVSALAQAGAAARGATVYVTLEPCSHFGRTPPCTGALIAAGVGEVVVGALDPAAHASGRGIDLLRAAGVRVRAGVLAHACASAHEHYLHHEATRLPFVTLKIASSLDGQIAAGSGDSKWITGEAARRLGHWLRARHHAIAVGADTVLRDDPALSVRMVTGVDPLPVIFDSGLRVAGAAQRPTLLRPGTVVLHTSRAPTAAQRSIDDLGLRRIELTGDAEGRVDVAGALQALGQLPLRSLLVEGGGRMIASFVAAGAWQRFYWFHAPVILGDGKPAAAGLKVAAVADATRLRPLLRTEVGVDGLTILGPPVEPATEPATRES